MLNDSSIKKDISFEYFALIFDKAGNLRIPSENDHSFRAKPITDSKGNRSLLGY